MPTGNYNLQAVADYTNTVTEGNETNNTTVGNAVSISSVPPDLVVTSVSGTVTNGILSYSVTIKNHGINAAGNHYTGIYLSTDATITTTDTLVTTYYGGGIPGGSSATYTGTVSVPQNRTGTYYVGAIADYTNIVPESDETNNGLAGNQVTITNDLVVTTISGTMANGKLTYSVTVHNNGNGQTGNHYTGIYLSTDATITTTDTLVDAYYAGGIPGGSSATYTGTISVPQNATGTYYVGAIADYTNMVPESDETNNGLAGNQISLP